MYLSIIIPCYNESKRIGKTLDVIGAHLKKQNYEAEVIVIDNGSTDNTADVAREYKDSIKNLVVLPKKSHGKGWAVKQGMRAAKGDYRLFTDADNSTDISQIEKLMPYADQGYDIIISSRKMPDSRLIPPQPWPRRILGNIFAAFVSVLIPLGVRDTQNGFKLFTKNAAEKIFPHQTVFYWAFDVEILALARIFGFKIKEVGVTWVNDERSTMNFRGMMRTLFEIVLLRLHLWTFDYKKLRAVARENTSAYSTARTYEPSSGQIYGVPWHEGRA